MTVMTGEAGRLVGSVLRIETDALSLSACLVPWDSESFGVPVAQIDRIEVRDLRRAEVEANALHEWLAEHDVKLSSCRIDHGRLHESFFLEAIGFRFVEMVYSMRKVISPETAAISTFPGLRWQTALPEDLSELRSIAAAAFVTGRWNIDWRVGEALAGRRYADWVGRSLLGSSHDVIKAVLEDSIAGFFIVEIKPDLSAYWHLTAIAPEFQGRGIGRAMWESMACRHAEAGLSHIGTTISARNVPVVNLYAKLGWRFETCQMTLHWAHPSWIRPSPLGQRS